jgi:hypothetical protein
MIDSLNPSPPIDLQAAGGLELESAVQVCRLGATSLPLGSALHREKVPAGQDSAPGYARYAAYLQKLRSLVQGTETA